MRWFFGSGGGWRCSACAHEHGTSRQILSGTEAVEFQILIGEAENEESVSLSL